MPLLNYTTQVEASKTAGQIQQILAKHGARVILMEYDNRGEVAALSFRIKTPYGEVGIRLPIDAEATLRVLRRQAAPRFANEEQAVRVAWRIVKDWVEAQMAILETETVKMEQIFLPYMITQDGRTLYERMIDSKFQLKDGQG